MRIAVVACMVFLQVFGCLATVASVGKPRKPLTGGVAATTTVVAALFIVGTLYLA